MCAAGASPGGLSVLSLASPRKGRRRSPALPSVDSAGPQPSTRPGSQRGGTGYLEDCQLPTLGCLEEKGNRSGTMQTEALNNYKRGAAYWKLKVLSLTVPANLGSHSRQAPPELAEGSVQTAPPRQNGKELSAKIIFSLTLLIQGHSLCIEEARFQSQHAVRSRALPRPGWPVTGLCPSPGTRAVRGARGSSSANSKLQHTPNRGSPGHRAGESPSAHAGHTGLPAWAAPGAQILPQAARGDPGLARQVRPHQALGVQRDSGFYCC